MPHPISKTPLIFAAFANNEAAPLRKLALEQDDIKDIFEAPRLQGKCEICTQTAASPETIVKQFQKHHDRIRIFHYGGHSDQDTLFLYKDFPWQGPTKSTDLATFLANQPNLELVFINGCLSIQQAEKYHRAGVKAIIATDRRVDDEQAREFAVSFYRGLAGGASISTAFQMAVDSFPMIRGGNFRAQGWENDQQQGQALPWKLFPEGPHDWRLPIVPRELTQIPVIDLSERFLGREKEMDQLEKMLETSSTGVLISGIGGIGKSKLASAYVELFDKKYDHLAWINADRDPVTTLAFHPELADTLDLPFENGEAVQDRLRRILWELQKLPGRNLLVIDNASEQIAQKEIYAHLPTAPKWQKIITSRRQIPGFDPLELGTFSPTAAKDLFLMISPKAETDEGLEDLLQEIEYHPLTIELFARLFNNLNATCTLTELTATLRQQQLANLSQKIWVDYHPEEQTVYAHLQAAFDISREILTGFEIWLLKQFIVLPAADYPFPHLAELLQDELHLRKFFQADHEDTKLAQKFLTWALRVGRKKDRQQNS